MLRFRQFIIEVYDYDRSPLVPKEMHDANDHVVDMVEIDENLRKQVELPGRRLLNDMSTLNAIHDHYLASRHGDKYPEHAAKIKEYENIISAKVPHLMAQIRK